MTEDLDVGSPLPEEGPSRTFTVAVSVVGALLVLSIVCLAVYMLVIVPRQQAAREARPTEDVLEMTQAALDLTEAAEVEPTATSTPVVAAIDPTATNTPTVVVAPTNTPTLGTFTPTSAAQIAAQVDTATPTPSPTSLPSTGLADQVGVQGLVLVGLALIAVIILARQLRRRSAS